MPAAATARDAVKGAGLAGLIGALTPVWAAHRAYSTVRTSRHRGRQIVIDKVALADRPLAEVIASARPVIITDLHDRVDWPVYPDVDGLRALAATRTEPFVVQAHDAATPYFLYVGDYGARLLRRDTLSLDEFCDLMFSNGVAEGESTYRLFSVNDLGGVVGEIVDAVAAALEQLADRRADRQASGLWIGSTGVTTPLHHDAWTGLLMQFSGSKRIAMYAPHDRVNLSFVSPFEPTGRWSTLPPDSSTASPDEHPRLERADRFVAQLDAGDTLFIPPFWSHEVEALEPNISMPFRFTTRPVEFANPGFLRPAVEIFHGKYLADRHS